jgi:hypothetical protein
LLDQQGRRHAGIDAAAHSDDDPLLDQSYAFRSAPSGRPGLAVSKPVEGR